nr:MAG TPA: hypothetical protein [Caudoviricetes sp.]
MFRNTIEWKPKAYSQRLTSNPTRQQVKACCLP